MGLLRVEVAGAICFLLMTLVFVVFPLRRNIFFSALNAASALLFLSYVLATLKQFRASDWIVMTAGLLLYWVGLFFTRVMLLRSVSLNLLIRLSRGEQGNSIRQDIAGRLGDMQAYGMVEQEKDHYGLKPFGGFWAFWVNLLYALLRLQP